MNIKRKKAVTIRLSEKALLLSQKSATSSDQENANEKARDRIHGLELCQIGSDLQINELRLALEKAELLAERYIGFFDFSPSGYFELSENGEIIELNLEGANLLGRNRSSLKKNAFGFFITDDTKPTFNFFLNKLFSKRTKETCELILTPLNSEPINVLLSGIHIENTKHCFINVVDITLQKQTEKALSDNVKKFSDLFENANVGKTISTLDGKLTVNKKYCENIGYSKEELEHLHWQEFTHPDDRERDLNFVERMLKGEMNSFNFEKRYIHKNGTIVYFDLYIVIQRDDEGNPLYLITNVIDITDRKKAEAELIISENKFRSIFNNNPSAITINELSDQFRIIECNDTFEKITGYSREEIVGFPIEKFNLFVDSPAKEYVREELQRNKRVSNFEHRYRKKNGDIGIGLLSVEPIQLDNKPCVIVVNQDISDLKLAEKGVKILNKAMEQSHSIIVITNSQGEIEFVNKSFEAIMQFTFEEKKGDYPRIFKPGKLDSDTYETMWKTLHSGEVWQCELMNTKKDGTLFYVSICITPINDESGMLSNYVIVMDDITEKKNILDELILAKEKAEESDRLKAAFLQNISHEIRTPMNAILGFSSFLKDPDLKPNDLELFTDTIVDNCNQLLSIITDIVNIATIEAGQEVVDEKPTNVNEVCKYLYGKFNQNAVMTDIAFSYHAPLEDIEVIVQADELKLRIVLDNLINNAFKFTPEGSIKFGYMLKDDMLEFWVKDTGIGISPDKQADIFKRFQQGNNEASRIYGGSGLGLAIAKAYVELMGGAIKVVSAPGQGSTFLFTIPYKK